MNKWEAEPSFSSKLNHLIKIIKRKKREKSQNVGGMKQMGVVPSFSSTNKDATSSIFSHWESLHGTVVFAGEGNYRNYFSRSYKKLLCLLLLKVVLGCK